jgi:hypothetical protein
MVKQEEEESEEDEVVIVDPLELQKDSSQHYRKVNT